MCPAPAAETPGQDVVARYCELLNELDKTVYLGDLTEAETRNSAISEFLGGLDRKYRASLEDGQAVLPGWTGRRIGRLRDRWQALQLHGGSWIGWCKRLGESHSSEDSEASREAFLGAARDLVYRQAPDAEQRPALWCFCAGATEDTAQRQSQDFLLDSAGRSAENKDFEEIMLDVERTPNLAQGQNMSLANILVTYCTRQSTGERLSAEGHYVQGMHMLAACPLWAGLSEARALAVFEFVLNSLCVGYYVDAAFAAFQRDVRVADALIADRLPQLSAALRAAGVSTMMLTFDSLLCLFTRSMALKSVLRLWDVFLLEGDVAVFAVLLALLERLLPDAQLPADGMWESFPFAERLREQSAHTDAEDLLGRAKAHLDRPGESNLREQVQRLRRKFAVPEHHQGEGLVEVCKHSDLHSDDWWNQALTQVRGWWDGGISDGRGANRGHGGVASGGRSSSLSFPPAVPQGHSPVPLQASNLAVLHLGNQGQKLGIAHTGETVNSEHISGPSRGEFSAFATLPVEFAMTLSQEYKPGDLVVIKGPHGRMQVQPPDDAEPGSVVRYRLGPRPDFEIRVPPDAGPGQEVNFVRHDGVEVSATVPDGMLPGDIFGVMPPAVMVLVPEGAELGDIVAFQAVGGPIGWYSALVPPGTRLGRYFAARLPPPRPEPSRGWWADLLDAL
mmetsp:Transcript_127762/g.408505  ORF Transcript_127762/g.408505 Transcript_127762/m.408505 type:complete len:676 (+) Transcript_127762:165-2192(+)